MKKRILTLILVIVMLLPAGFAVAKYIMSKGGPIDSNVVTDLKITDPAGKVFSFSKTEPSGIRGNMIAFFADLNESATEIAEVPSQITEENQFTAEYTSFDKTSEYKYYFLSYDEDAYYSDADGKAYRLDPEYAKEFMRSPYCGAIFASSAAPKLLFPSGESVTPLKLDWKYLVSATVYSDDNHFETEKQDRYYDLVTGMDFGFDIEPGSAKVEITEATKEAEVYSGDFLRFDFSLLEEGNTYNFKLSAEWFETNERGSSGSADYEFAVKIIRQPSFAITSTNITNKGGVVELSAAQVADGRTVTVKTDPDFGISPVFVKDGDLMRAFFPLSPYIEEVPDTFTLTVGVAGYTVDYTMHVENVNIEGEENFSLPDETEKGAGSKDSYDKAYDYLNTNVYFTAPTARKFDTGIPLVQPVSLDNGGYLNSVYGAWRNDTASFSRMHRGLDYVAPEGSDVYACLRGEVALIGETDYTGKVIVIDHGMGLRSTYCHLDSVNEGLSVGDTIEAGGVIGKVGNTGAAGNIGVHFELTVGSYPISPVSYIYNGITLSTPLVQNAEEQAMKELLG